MAAAYATEPGPPPLCAASDDMVMMRPADDFVRCGSAARTVRNVDVRLVDITRSKWSSVISAIVARPIRCPALQTSTSRPPRNPAASSTTRSTSAVTVTSAWNAFALRPSASIAETVFAASSAEEW